MARKKADIHYIYKTTCNVTGRWYIGMHSTSNEDDGYMGSGKRLRYSIRKYGKNNHTKEIFEYCDSREELINREREIINEDLISEDLCMNIALGGEGGYGSKFLSKEQLSKGGVTSNLILQERLKDEEYRKEWVGKISKSVKEFYGDTRNGICFYDRTGIMHTDEIKKQISETKKGTGTGETNSQYGTCWITNGIENKKIKKSDLIPEDWRLGRIIK